VRSVRREVLLTALGSTALAVATTWPTLRHPATTVPGDLADPVVEAWMASWGGHALLAQPLHLFQGNTFWPLPDSYAFNDTLLGYAPVTMFGGGNSGALISYNLLFVLTYAMAFAGAYLLARQLGARPVGALVAGSAYAYAPWRLAHDGHLNVLSSGAIPLALAMLARGHGYGGRGHRRTRVRPGWVLAGWAVAAWQVSLGFALGLAFAYALLMVCAGGAIGWLLAGRPRLPARLIGADLAGGLAFTAVTGLLSVPYLRVLAAHPEATRGPADLALFSPPLSGYLIAPANSWLWGTAQTGARAKLGWPPEMALLPGFLVLGLATAGLLISSAPVRRRLWLAAVVLLSVALGLGTRLAGGRYTMVAIQAHLPGWGSVRTSGRLVLYTTLALGLLAAYAVTRLAQLLPRRARPVLLLLPAAVLVEGLGRVPQLAVPPEPPAMRGVAGPMLVLPSDAVHDNIVMFWSTNGWPLIANGSTSVQPRAEDDLRRRVAGFPDSASVAYLRGLGFRSVVLLPGYAYGTPWQGAESKPVTGLPLTRRLVRGNDWVFDLDR